MKLLSSLGRPLLAGLGLFAVAAWGQAPADQDLVSRGAYLARAADCLACHLAEGGKPYAGGLPFKLPFGTLYSPNITPDKETGIGDWSDDDFVRAMQQGIGKDGRHYYPAFPYTSFTLMPREDILAIKAYLFSLAPVHQPNKANDLRFPFNQRWGMAIWNLFFLDDQRFTPDPQQSAEWNRGRYLVEGPGHCAECHSPRNLFQARSSSQHLAGTTIQGWRAWNITSDPESGIGGWSDEALASYLSTGLAEGHGVAAGPMAEVVNHSLSHLTAEDIRAMVSYLKTVPPQPAEVRRPPQRPLADQPPEPGDNPLGYKLFADACAGCHLWNGKGRQNAYAALAGLRTVNDPQGINLVQVMLKGSEVRGRDGLHTMPPFHAYLDDREAAALGNFVLRHFGQQEGKLTPDIIRERRAE